MLQRGTSLIRQPECSRCLSAAPRSGDTPTQAAGEGVPQGRGRGATATRAGATVGNCFRCWAWAIVAATINNNAMWQPTARISCKNLFMTLCCNCVGHTILTSQCPTGSCPPHSVATSHSRFALFLGAGLLLLLLQQQHCSPATDLWHTNRPNNNWPHLVSFPAVTAWQLAQNVARISLGSAQFSLSLSLSIAFSHANHFAATHHFSARFSDARCVTSRR